MVGWLFWCVCHKILDPGDPDLRLTSGLPNKFLEDPLAPAMDGYCV